MGRRWPSTVSGGVLNVDGARVFSTNIFYTPGRALEFYGTFGAQAYQHMGFGQSFATVEYESWAMFSTLGTTNSLYARTNNNGVTVDALIPGSWIGLTSPVPDRMEGLSACFSTLTVDLVNTQIVSIPTGMRPGFSDYTMGGPSVQVSWMRVTPYAATGTFTSRILRCRGSGLFENVELDK